MSFKNLFQYRSFKFFWQRGAIVNSPKVSSAISPFFPWFRSSYCLLFKARFTILPSQASKLVLYYSPINMKTVMVTPRVLLYTEKSPLRGHHRD